MTDYNAWIGREEQRRDAIDPAAVTRWLATLDRDPAPGQVVPQGYHWCLALPDAGTAALGPDGHPRRDDSPTSFLPPIPQPRRMWASSTVEFVRPLRVGEAIERRSRVAAVTAKQGGSGSLVFVEVEHTTEGGDGVAVREVQSLVYRDPPPAGSPAVPPALGDGQFEPAGWDAHRALTPHEPLLFRYSALTFNSHRIHYDLAYARGEENFRGLVVHGPLTATLLLDLARRELGDNTLKRFAFRGVSPAICGEPLHLVLRRKDAELELGAFAGDGRTVMSATAAT
ncbi:MAG: MaoC family dehydratase N-terminal domain-containing protein [Novosphingobium sp.]